MNIIYILLLLPSLIHCAADKFITHAPLRDGMWGTPSSPVKDYRIHLGTRTHPALTEHEVMNPFWLQMKDAPQEEKDNICLTIVNARLNDFLYPAERTNLAAAAWIGANLAKVQVNKERYAHFAYNAVLFNDIPLANVLLTHKASVHEKNHFNEEIIFTAKTVDMANLLIKKYETLNAIQNLRGLYGRTLLHKVMNDDYEPELIPFYRSLGVSPMEKCDSGYTPLMNLAFHNPDLKRAELLLQELPHKEKIQLIAAKNNNKENVFDLMKRSLCSENERTQQKIIEKFLRNILESPAQEDPKPSKALVSKSHSIANGPLPAGMWGAHNYLGYKPDPRPFVKATELTKSSVMNSFWLNMKNASQETKDDALFQVLRYHDYYNHLDVRRNVAAALWAGANPRNVEKILFFVNKIVTKNDLPLARLLLAHNSLVHYGICQSILFNAKTVNMAKLLILFGVCDNIRDLRYYEGNGTLLHSAMSKDHEPALIPFYKSLGVSSMAADNESNSPLATLLQYHYHDKKNLLKKTASLLTGLTPVQKVALLTKLYRHTKGMHYITQEPNPYNELAVLNIFLKKTAELALNKIESDECSICTEPFHPKGLKNSVTSCNHIFHRECLDRWKQQSKICPCCGTNITYSLKIKPSDFYGKSEKDKGKEEEVEEDITVAPSSWTPSQGLDLSRRMIGIC